MVWGWAVPERCSKNTLSPRRFAKRLKLPSAMRGGDHEVTFVFFALQAMLLKFSPVAGRAKKKLCHWVGIASAKCRLKLKKHSVPWWLAFCFFVFFHCSPSGHGDLVRVYTRFGSKKTIHHLKFGVIFKFFLWCWFRVCRHMKFHLCLFFGWNWVGGKIKSPWHGKQK